MKTMTCQDLGGPCELAHHGNTADEIIKAQDKHLREMVAGGDQTHTPALDDMKGRWRHPISSMGLVQGNQAGVRRPTRRPSRRRRGLKARERMMS